MTWKTVCVVSQLMAMWIIGTSGVGPCDGETICGEGTVCKVEGDSYSCKCKPGYDKKTRHDNGYILCQDKDECEDVSICLSDETCTNTVGSYRCGCRVGYRRQRVGCKDIDECESSVAICGSGICNNTRGAFVCLCPDGTSTNGTPCEDEAWAGSNTCVIAIVVGTLIFLGSLLSGVIIFIKVRCKRKKTEARELEPVYEHINQ